MTLIKDYCCGLELRAGQFQMPVQETRSVNNKLLLKEQDKSKERNRQQGTQETTTRGLDGL